MVSLLRPRLQFNYSLHLLIHGPLYQFIGSADKTKYSSALVFAILRMFLDSFRMRHCYLVLLQLIRIACKMKACSLGHIFIYQSLCECMLLLLVAARSSCE